MARQAVARSERDMPRSDDAERSVLGAIVAHQEALFDVAGVLRPEHFANHYHAAIYTAMQRMAAENRPIDEITLHAELGGSQSEIARAFVQALSVGVPRGTNVTYYAGLIINAAKLRRTIEHANRIIDQAHTAKANANEVVEFAQGGYFDIGTDAPRQTLWWADEMTAELFRTLQQHEDPTPDYVPVTVGLPSVDATFEGFGPGDLAFIAGRPSTGKTALANQIALRTATDGVTLVCSLEMKHTAIWRRALANIARISLPQYTRRRFSDREQQIIGEGIARLGNLQLAIEDVPRATEMQILATARRVQMQRGLRLVIVDYLQLMRCASSRFENRSQELGELTRSLKEIAMTLNVPIVVLAALSRAAANERPNMAHIRECGTAEYDADHIFLMHRDVDAQKDLEQGQPSPSELIIEKQRNGPTGSIPLLFFGEFYRFESKAVA